MQPVIQAVPQSCVNTLDKVLQPYGLEGFLSRFWEKDLCHVRREDNPELEHFFGSLIELDDIDRLLTTVYSGGMRSFDSVRIGQDGGMISPSLYTRNPSASVAEIDIDKVLALYRGGASIILTAINENFEPLNAFCNHVSSMFGVPVQANAYITPPRSQGFPVHFDTHDVFLLQIAGEKEWRIFEAPYPLAIPSMRGRAFHLRHGSPPAHQLCLRAAEVLYLPRGMLHEGLTSKEMSFHLTIGVHSYTWGDVIRDVLLTLQTDDSRFRQSVVPRLTAVDEKALPAGFLTELSDTLFSPERIRNAVLEKAVAFRRSRRPNSRGRFMQMVASSEITLDTRVRVRTAALVETRNGKVALDYNQTSLALPCYVEQHVRSLVSGKIVSARDLPSDLDDDGKLVLVRRLVDEGVLETV